MSCSKSPVAGALTVVSIVLVVLLFFMVVSFSITVVLLNNEKRHRRFTEDALTFFESDVHEHKRKCNVVAAFVIHLKHRTDRDENIRNLKECLSGLVAVEVVEANDGSSLTDRKIGRGEAGCFLSHMGICERISTDASFCSSSDNWVLIFEDDVTMNVSCGIIRQRILEGLQDVPALTPVVYLGFNEPPKRDTKRVGKHTYVGFAPWTMHAYAVRCVHAHKLVTLLKKNVGNVSIDRLMRKIVANAGFVYADEYQRRVMPHVYGCGLFGQDTASLSGIQSNAKNLSYYITKLKYTIENLSSEK